MIFRLFVLFALFSPSVLAAPLTVKDGKVTFLAKGTPGFLSVEGTGGEAVGKLNRDGNNISGDLRVQMDKFSVPIDLRNSHMKDTVLKVKEFPESTLKLTTFEVDSAGVANKKPFKGTLKLRGVEKPVSGVASLKKDGALAAEFVISLKEFGFEPIKYATVKILDEVAVNVDAVLVAEGGAASAAPPVKK